MKKRLTSILAGLTSAVLALSLCVPALAAANGKQAIEDDPPPGVRVAGRQWLRDLDPTNGGIYYAWPKPKETRDYDALPMLRPTWLPEGYLLHGIGAGRAGVDNDSLTWTFVKDGTPKDKIVFNCYRPTNRSRGFSFGVGLDTAALRRDAKVQNRSADFYRVRDDGSFNVLVWEDAAGNLFWLQGAQDQAVCEKIAASVKDPQDKPLPALGFGWMPEGFTQDALGNLSTPAIVEGSWSKVTQAEGQPTHTAFFCWFYSREALSCPTGTKPETVKVNGVRAQYWPGDPKAPGIAATVDGKVVAVTTSAEQTGTLVWTDPKTKINFHFEAPFDRDTMIRMAESVTAKAPEPPKAPR